MLTWGEVGVLTECLQAKIGLDDSPDKCHSMNFNDCKKQQGKTLDQRSCIMTSHSNIPRMWREWPTVKSVLCSHSKHCSKIILFCSDRRDSVNFSFGAPRQRWAAAPRPGAGRAAAAGKTDNKKNHISLAGNMCR